jgi:hypothetical protein
MDGEDEQACIRAIREIRSKKLCYTNGENGQLQEPVVLYSRLSKLSPEGG